jgi:hypothetical protein
MNSNTNRMDDNPANRDPITGAPGSHPVGTGLGAAGAGAAGAAIGSVAGPVGTVAGAAIGAVAGGLAGKAAGEAVNPTTEDAYWRQNYRSRPYAAGLDYDNDLAPAYRYGWASAGSHAGRSFDEAENDLRAGWERTEHGARHGWDKMKDAVRDAWDRIVPGRGRTGHRP